LYNVTYEQQDDATITTMDLGTMPVVQSCFSLAVR